MSRSTEPPSQWPLLGTAVALACAMVFVPPAAHATAPPGTPAAQRVFVPEPFDPPDELPSYPLVDVTEDTDHVAQRAGSTGRTDWRLDANLVFSKDSDVIRPAVRARLAQVAAELAQAPAGTVRITGYTDDLGSAVHGLDLSRRRARAVQDALGRALARHRVSVVGLGEAHPLVPNTSESNRARNRRVEISFQRG